MPVFNLLTSYYHISGGNMRVFFKLDHIHSLLLGEILRINAINRSWSLVTLTANVRISLAGIVRLQLPLSTMGQVLARLRLTLRLQAATTSYVLILQHTSQPVSIVCAPELGTCFVCSLEDFSGCLACPSPPFI